LFKKFPFIPFFFFGIKRMTVMGLHHARFQVLSLIVPEKNNSTAY